MTRDNRVQRTPMGGGYPADDESTPLSKKWSRPHHPALPGQWFLRLPESVGLSRQADWQLLHQGPHSYVYSVEEPANSYVAKVVVPRSKPRDNLRKYGRCQALREFRSARILQALGLQTPTVLGWGLSLRPDARFESVLFMGHLPACTSGLSLIRHEKDPAARYDFLDRFARQLATLHRAGLIHKDCHFANLCIDQHKELIWIDNDVRRPRNARGRRTGLKKTKALLAATARDDLSAAEWDRFQHRFHAHLDKPALKDQSAP